MAQVIKVGKLTPVGGSDHLSITYLAPMGLPVVVDNRCVGEGYFGIFIPAGTSIPEHLRRLVSTNNGVVEPKVFFGAASMGVIVPAWKIPSVAPGDMYDLAATGLNINAELGMTGPTSTATFDGKITAEINNQSGEVVTLFADGQVLLYKPGKSTMVGPLAPQGSMVMESEPQTLEQRFEEIGESKELAGEVFDSAAELFSAAVDQIQDLAYGATDLAEGICKGYRLASNVAFKALERAAVAGFGPVQGQQLLPLLFTVVATDLASAFTDMVEDFEEELDAA